MRLTVKSNKLFLLKSLESQIQLLVESEQDGINSTLEFGLGELVRHEMRFLARTAEAQLKDDELLEQSIQRAVSQLNDRLQSQNVSFDLNPYLPSIRNALQFPAKEIAELSQNYHQNDHKAMLKILRLQQPGPVDYQLIQVGAKSTSGIMIWPLEDEFDVVLDPESEDYEIDGHWFPFSLKTSIFPMVLNDDGSLFVALDIALSKVEGELQIFALSEILKVRRLIYRKTGEDLEPDSDE